MSEQCELGHQATCGPDVAENSVWLENWSSVVSARGNSREVLRDSAERGLVGQVL